MKTVINGVLYDTKSAVLMAVAESMTALSRGVSTRLYKSYSGQWFLSISPVKGNNLPIISNWISTKTAKRWLEKHRCDLPLRVYFDNSVNRLKHDHQIMVAEWKSPSSICSPDLVQVERMYHHPHKGWCVRQIKETVIIPLTTQEAAEVAKILQFD